MIQRHRLYDLATDPVEMNDLAATMPDRVNDLAGPWEAWAGQCNVVPHPRMP